MKNIPEKPLVLIQIKSFNFIISLNGILTKWQYTV